jgi:hypothetical protein
MALCSYDSVGEGEMPACPSGETRLHFLPQGKKIEVLPPYSWRQATVHRTVVFNLSSLSTDEKSRDGKSHLCFFGKGL